MSGISVLGFFSQPFAPTTTTFLTTGGHLVTIPNGSSLMTLEIEGGGGGGGGSSTTVVGNGGGSGGRCVSTIAISPSNWGQTLALTCGAIRASSGVAGAVGFDGSQSTVNVMTFSGSFTSMVANGGGGGNPFLGGGGAGGTATGGNVTNQTGVTATSGNQNGAAGLTGTFVNGLSGATGANHPGSTSQPDTATTLGQGAVHFS
jgi:hypothetical protein